MASRTPPLSVCEKLRKEVNFGCPVKGCGVPYLTFHHSDPPWEQEHSHHPEGMIALCATHAAHADGGRWTEEQLRRMKKSPYVSLGRISDYYGYLRKDAVCIVGNVAFDVKNVLEINGERVIGFERDENGYNRLNLLIRDLNGNAILRMEDNTWTAISRDLFDLRCSGRGKELEIMSKDRKTRFYMRFDDYPIDVFRDLLLERYEKGMLRLRLPWLDPMTLETLKEKLSRNVANKIDIFISHIGSPKSVSTWTIRGTLLWHNVHLDIRDFGIEDLTTHNTFAGGFVVGSRTAFGFSSRSADMGIS